MAIDPSVVEGGVGVAIISAFAIVLKIVLQQSKKQGNAVIEAVGIIKALFPNGAGEAAGIGGKGLKSDGIPGFAPECMRRVEAHGGAIQKNASDIEGMKTRVAGFDGRFDGINAKIESVRRDLKGDIEELKDDVAKRLDDLKTEIREAST